MSTPQFSLIVFADGREKTAELDHFHQDIESFFKKFSIPYEILWLKGPHRSTQEFLRLAASAQAPFIATLNARLTSPLGDVFKLLQNLLAEEELQIVFGDRFIKQKEIAGHSVYTRILKDRKSLILSDPFCEYLALRKTALTRITPIAETAGTGANKSRFITAQLQKITLQEKLKVLEVPIHEIARHEKFNFWQSLQKIWFVLRF